MTLEHAQARPPEELAPTLGHCVSDGLVAAAEIEAALAALLANAEPLRVAPGIFAVLPEFERLPLRLRRAMVEIALLARV